MPIPEAGLLTVVDVKVTDDLKIANIYFSFLENKKPAEDVIKIIKAKKKQIRHHVRRNIDLKYTPEFRFYYDNTMEYVEKIDKLINKIHQDD